MEEVGTTSGDCKELPGQASITAGHGERGGGSQESSSSRQEGHTGAATVTSMMLLFTLLANNRTFIAFSPQKSRIIATKIGKLK